MARRLWSSCFGVSLTNTVKLEDSLERRLTSTKAEVRPLATPSLKLQERTSRGLGTNCSTEGDRGQARGPEGTTCQGAAPVPVWT